MWGKFIYHEVAEPERLVFVVSFADEFGGTTRHPLSAAWPLEVLNTVTLQEQPDGTTILTLTESPINATNEECQTFEQGFDGMKAGFGATMDQLEAFLATG